MKIKNNQSGIAHLAAILAIGVVVAIGVVGWKVWDSSKDDKKATTTSAKTTKLKPLTIDESTELVKDTLETTAAYVKRTTSADQGEIDSVKHNLSDNLYGELIDDERYGITSHDPFTCAQDNAASYKLSAEKNSEGTTPSIQVVVEEDFGTIFKVFYVVDPATHKIVKITCGDN